MQSNLWSSGALERKFRTPAWVCVNVHVSAANTTHKYLLWSQSRTHSLQPPKTDEYTGWRNRCAQRDKQMERKREREQTKRKTPVVKFRQEKHHQRWGEEPNNLNLIQLFGGVGEKGKTEEKDRSREERHNHPNQVQFGAVFWRTENLGETTQDAENSGKVSRGCLPLISRRSMKEEDGKQTERRCRQEEHVAVNYHTVRTRSRMQLWSKCGSFWVSVWLCLLRVCILSVNRITLVFWIA